MWPYNDDEAGWLEPEKQPKQLLRTPANDNDPARHAPMRALPAPARKTDSDA